MRGRHLPPGIANAVPSLQVVCTSRRRRAEGSCSNQSTLDLNPLFRDSELADSASRFFILLTVYILLEVGEKYRKAAAFLVPSFTLGFFFFASSALRSGFQPSQWLQQQQRLLLWKRMCFASAGSAQLEGWVVTEICRHESAWPLSAERRALGQLKAPLLFLC